MTLLDFVEDHRAIVAVEGITTRNHEVENYPQGPDVALFPVVAVENFRRDEVGSPCNRVHALILLGGLLGQAEIYELGLSCLGVHHVFRLQIPVDHPGVVTVNQRPQYGVYRLSCVSLRKLAAHLLHALEEFAPLAKLHYKVDISRCFVSFIILHNVWMIQFS